MLVPSVWPTHRGAQVCALVKAPGAVRGAETLRMHAGRMGGLAEDNKHARAPVFGEMGSAATPLRARDGAPGQLPSHDTRESDAHY